MPHMLQDGERFADVNIVNRVAHDGGGVMVWAGVMAFCVHRDTVRRSWGPLLCHSSTTITSCCSMIMHSPMLQGSLHNSWKMKTSQFFMDYLSKREVHVRSNLAYSVLLMDTMTCSSAQPRGVRIWTSNLPTCSTRWATAALVKVCVVISYT